MKRVYTEIFNCGGTAYSRRVKRECPDNALGLPRERTKIILKRVWKLYREKCVVCKPCRHMYRKELKASNKVRQTAIALIHAGRLISGLRDVNRIIAWVLWKNEGVI